MLPRADTVRAPQTRIDYRAVLQGLLCLIAPNSPLAIFLIAAALLETALVGAAGGEVLQLPGAIRFDVLLILLAVWLPCGWVLSAASSITARVAARAPRWAGGLLYALLTLVLTACGFLYLVSWAMRLRTGSFPTLDAVEFFLSNSGESWLVSYLVRSERAYVVGVGLCTALLAAGLPFALRWMNRTLGLQTRNVSVARFYVRRALVWLLVLISATVVHVRRIHDPSQIRRTLWAEAVQCRMNPAITLVVGWAAGGAEKVEPTLQPGQLCRIAGHPWTPPAPAGPLPSILFVAIESLRADMVHFRHQGHEVMPHLNRLARSGLQFTRAYAQSTHSDYSDVCILSSLYPLRSVRHHYYSASDPWPKTLIYDLLKPAGYATAIISSQNEKWGGMDQFFRSDKLDLYYDAERAGIPTRLDLRDTGFAVEVQSGALRAGSLDDRQTADEALRWIRAQVRQGKPFFVNINFQSSHFPYELPTDCPRPFQPCTIDFDASFLAYPREKIPVVRNAYYNALYECDRQLGRLVETLRELGQLDRTILVVMGENGEAFYENGAVSHAGRPVEPAVRVALVLHAPGLVKPGVCDYPAELVDVVPTVLGRLGWPRHPNFQGIDVLASDRPPLAQRYLFFHTENPLSHTDGLLYQGRWKLIHDRASRMYALYDVQTDPAESVNLFSAKPPLARKLAGVLRSWRQGQLAYYRYPNYYLAYYPPQPQVLISAAERDAARRPSANPP